VADWDERQHPRNPRTGEFVGNDAWIRRLSDQMVETDVLYHGTTVEDLEQVLSASQHRRTVTFPHDTDVGFAYATASLQAAWHYAELAWNNGVGDVPRVYRVRATGPTEDDPFYDQHGRARSNFSGDVRSRHPFDILDELPTPDHFIDGFGEDED
jgi:hypothetical protein